jgi:hypothetical protein
MFRPLKGHPQVLGIKNEPLIQCETALKPNHNVKNQITVQKRDITIMLTKTFKHRLCGLVVSVADYKHRGPGFDSRALRRIFLRELGLERGPLSLLIG